ncbi:MAG: hypothetical protein J6J42_07385 [Lachnospiraceae bacterium]|nr:hypothetical protein [Lachnospiraceae bacterium]
MAGANGMTYIRMMLDVLTKKEVHLAKILQYTTEQSNLLKQTEFDELEFLQLVERKDGIIKKIGEFDNGFQSIFNRVSEELQVNKEEYKEQVLEMQGLITRITDLGVKIAALEEKNRSALEFALQGKKKSIRQFKVGKQTADKYYKNMIGLQAQKSYFMDQKN